VGRIDLSVIAPMHNEEGNVVALYEDIHRVVSPLGRPYEIIFVNDVSTDQTLARMKEIHCRDPHFHFVDLQTNVGENWALLAGIAKAGGEILVSIDGDYQNDPAYIPVLLDELAKGYHVVSGRRRQRVENIWSRLLPSQIANWLIRVVSGVQVHDCGCGLKAYRKDVLEGKFVPKGFLNRFSPASLGVRPEEFSEVDVVDRPRISGQSHYGFNRVFLVARDLLVLPFALRGPKAWLIKFRALEWLSLLATAVFAFQGWWGSTLGAALVAIFSFSNAWNLQRFVRAQAHPEFRIKEYR
jgi:glycosyltransferase involved in cell wall biosynthesis